MIVIDAGEQGDRTLEAKILFAAQLAARGHAAVIDAATLPDTLDRNQKYEIAPHLVDRDDIDITRLVLIGADALGGATLGTIRAYGLGPDIPVAAIGRFADHQARIGAASKLAYALGREAKLIDLGDFQPRALLEGAVSPLMASPAAAGVLTMSQRPRLCVVLPQEMLDDPLVLPLLAAMDQVAAFALHIVISGKGKDQIRASRYGHLAVFGLSELSAQTLARHTDIVAFYGDAVPGERMAVFALEAMGAGKAVIDATASGALQSCGAPVLRGPTDLGALPHYIDQSVRINLADIARHIGDSAWLKSVALTRLERALDLTPPPPLPSHSHSHSRAPRTVFVPTNGNGLGHAQRCTLIAAALPEPDACVFAAFPSCVPLVRSRGFACLPLVQKSGDHPEEFANDLLNHLRLQQVLCSGDRLVFDGGYVFDSIYRAIMDKGLDATWVRRGLWQAGQMSVAALDRSKAFARIVTPGEAFDELNDIPVFGGAVHQVGPIVQQTAPDPATRDRLRRRLGRDFDRLVVTMLGGGVAADRSAQLQCLCNLMERRADTLHLIVVWPGSQVSTGIYGWQNSRPVQTRRALALCQAADLVISAAGYNSFHELLYHGIPAVFVPQMAAYMDDQERRARAASQRGLAATVLASELMLLEREVGAFLDTGKADEIRAALGAAALPPRGNAAAAALIAQGPER